MEICLNFLFARKVQRRKSKILGGEVIVDTLDKILGWKEDCFAFKKILDP